MYLVVVTAPTNTPLETVVALGDSVQV
jgi:hypothetical protein